MFNKLLVISGPTATGKTDLAVELAKKYNGELVSGDSCQIYKGMDIGTGKDQPEETPIHLIDIVTPDQKFSVADFQKIGLETIKEIQSRNKLPILVGCSGFYIDSLINPNYTTFSVKPHKIWRFISRLCSVKTLQKIYQFLDPENFSKLNHSEINNHYRLTRKIEIKLFSPKNKNLTLNNNDFDLIHVSLTAPMDFLYHRIDARVQKRIDIGFLDEVKKLLKKYKWTDPGMQIGAYQCLRPYFENKKDLDSCLRNWCYAEHSDARRQSCWFKTKSNATFFDITKTDFKKQIFTLVSRWYTKL
ncbi:MAG: tRNA (adenosine(37)-N6)-dimethylallyltransferase MiaA [Candidatus Shapirobacteria bacterium]|nr:tRNA (adenosine(37)-N6)-dimethylallyltransferase MiaA [Candidatus Shapirobacteria bacterium]